MSLVTLQVISPVNNSNDVFDHVVLVRDQEGTEFTLGCAHFCKWTEEQLATADKLEGCFTPREYEEDSRLLLGYHPSAFTQWSFDETPEGVFIHLEALEQDRVSYVEEVISLDFAEPLAYYRVKPNLRLLQKLWEETQAEDEPRRIQMYFRVLTQLIEAGRIREDYARLAFSNIVEPSLRGNWEVRWEMLESNNNLRKYYQRVEVISDNIDSGYACAWGIEGEQYVDSEEDWEVYCGRVGSYAARWLIINYSGVKTPVLKVQAKHAEWHTAVELPFI